ncbi:MULTISPECIES: hypothetical protein [unclassified Bradyrhizobium]|uniref:hypothetical protein n=1 Tax=unclassified Bradyrhizobium TaxID=2631580 RepID=UPI001FFB74A5|nr:MULTISPECIES: hypothetical protein [unclassified Bradyrhizobium]MCK1533710.1 hypothetical protein [Bradyrhizobium sp. 176]MCK1560470.1 hypothetical protein [Bradyrhizobium sp. 171]
MTRWHPSLDLERLFESLSVEILSATDEEVRQMSDHQGWKVANTAQELRKLIRAAGADVGVKQDCDGRGRTGAGGSIGAVEQAEKNQQ